MNLERIFNNKMITINEELAIYFLVILFSLLIIYFIIRMNKLRKIFNNTELEKKQKAIILLYEIFLVVVLVAGNVMVVLFGVSADFILVFWIFILPSSIIVIFIIKLELLTRTPELGFFEKLAITRYKSNLLGYFFLVFCGFWLTEIPKTYVLAASIVVLLVLLLTFDEYSNSLEKSIWQLTFITVISVKFTGFGIFYWSSFLTIILLFWLLFQLQIKLEFTNEEKELIETGINPLEVNSKNKLISQIFLMQMQVRIYLNSLQANYYSLIIYFSTIIVFSKFLSQILGSLAGLSFTLFIVSLDLNTRIVAKRFSVNKKLLQFTENNLPEIKKREMHRIVTAVNEFAAAHPAASAGAATSLTAGAVSLIASALVSNAINEETQAVREGTLAQERATLAQERATLAQERATLAQERATLATIDRANLAADRANLAAENYIEESEKTRLDENRRTAMEKLKKGVTTDSHKANLLKMLETGEIPETMYKTLREELLANNKSVVEK